MRFSLLALKITLFLNFIFNVPAFANPFVSLVISSVTQSLAKVDDGASHCEHYLISINPISDFVLTDSVNFNLHLGQINDLDSLRAFISQLSKNFDSLSAYDKRTFLRSGLYELEKRSIPHLEQLDVFHQEALLRLFSQSYHKDLSADFVLGLQSSLRNTVSKMKARNLSAIVYLMGKLSIRMSPEVLNAIQLKAVEKIEDFSPQNMSNIVYGFSLVDVKPTNDFLKAWRDRYKQIYPQFENLNIANSLFSFYLMGSAEMVKWFVRATPEPRWAAFKAISERRQISQVFEYYFKVHQYVLQPIIRFKGHFNDLAKKPSGAATELEIKVGMVLALQGLDYEEEYKTSPGFYVDFFIPELNRIIQVDGPGHFIKELVNKQLIEIQRPQDLLIDEVLTAYGYNIRRRSYLQINK